MKKYIYNCERCDERIELEAPVEEYLFRVHKSCPNHELVPVIRENYDNLVEVMKQEKERKNQN